jgi:hypothetical protein
VAGVIGATGAGGAALAGGGAMPGGKERSAEAAGGALSESNGGGAWPGAGWPAKGALPPIDVSMRGGAMEGGEADAAGGLDAAAGAFDT